MINAPTQWEQRKPSLSLNGRFSTFFSNNRRAKAHNVPSIHFARPEEKYAFASEWEKLNLLAIEIERQHKRIEANSCALDDIKRHGVEDGVSEKQKRVDLRDGSILSLLQALAATKVLGPIAPVEIFAQAYDDRSSRNNVRTVCGVDGYDGPDHGPEKFPLTHRFLQSEWKRRWHRCVVEELGDLFEFVVAYWNLDYQKFAEECQKLLPLVDDYKEFVGVLSGREYFVNHGDVVVPRLN